MLFFGGMPLYALHQRGYILLTLCPPDLSSQSAEKQFSDVKN